MDWVTVGLISLICGNFIKARELLQNGQNYSECTSPLGLENGAIYDDDISCTIPPSVTNDNACANECKYVRYNISSSKSYWCGSYDNNSYGYYKVNLNQFSLITGFAVESGKTCLHCGIKTIKFGYESERNGFNSTVFKLSNDENYVWFDKAIIAKEVFFIPIEYNYTFPYFYARFELYGCPYWGYAAPVGLQSGLISDAQMSHGGTQITDYLNANAARLNTARFEGWRISGSDYYQTETENKVWLGIDLGLKRKLTSIVVRKIKYTSDYSRTGFFIYYGESYWSKKPYTGVQNKDFYYPTNKPMAVWSTYADGEGDSRYIFKYPLIAEYIEFYPRCQPCKSSMSVELYEESITKPSHHWPLTGSFEDKQSMQDLLPVEGAYLESDGLVINSTLKSQLKTLPYDADDCIVNPDNCGSGLTVSFSAKVTNIPNGTMQTDLVIPLSAVLDGTCSNNKADFNLNKKLGLYIKEVNNARGATVLSTTNMLISSFGSADEVFKLKATMYINKSQDFVAFCEYNSSSIQENRSGIVLVKGDFDSYKIVGMSTLLQAVFNMPNWHYGTSLVIVFEPFNGEENDIALSSKTWKLSKHVNLECYELQYGSPMPLKFSQPGVSCADNTLAAIAASFDVQHQWRNCHGPENYLEVDFGVTLFLAMIKVASHPLYYADEFNIRYAVNYTIWHNISNVDGGEFIFRKSKSGIEYLFFPFPIYAQHLRIYPVSYRGSFFQLELDVVLCNTFGELREVRKSVGTHEVQISLDESVIYLFRSTRCYKWCYCECYYVYEQYIGIDGMVQPTKNTFQFLGSSVPTQSNAFRVDKYGYFIRIQHNGQPRIKNSTDSYVYGDINKHCKSYDFISDEYILCLGTDNQVYRSSLPGTPDFTLIAPCCVYQIVVSDATGIIYGLTAEKTVVSRPLTTSLVPGGWTSLPPVTCTKLRTSKDGVLWCLSNGNILEWIPSKGRWTLAMSRSNCADFDVASTYIICTHSHALKRYPRSPEDNSGLYMFHGLTTQHYSTSYENTLYIYYFNGGGVYTYTLYERTTPPSSLLGMVSPEYRDVCRRIYGGPSNQLYCIEPSGIRYINNDINILRYEGKIMDIDFYADANFILFLNVSKDVVQLVSDGGYLVFNAYLAYGHDIVEFEYDKTNDTLYTLKDDGNVYKQKDSITAELYLTGPCVSFRMSPNGLCFCLYQGIWFLSVLNSWHVIFNEHECTSFHVTNTAVFCHTHDPDYIYSKVLPIGKDYLSEFPIILSGLQRVKEKSSGTGFQVSLSSAHSSLVVSVQTSTMLTRAVYPVNISKGLTNWNDYAFIWSRESNIISLYLNQTLVATKHGVVHSAIKSNGNDFVIIGGYYDHLASFEQNFAIRDLKVWKHNFTHDKFVSKFKNVVISGPVPATYENDCISVAINEDNDQWICGTAKNGIFVHPIEPSVSNNKWKYHSDKTCKKLEYMVGYLFCLDSNNTYLYLYFNKSWIELFSSEEVKDFTLAHDEQHILVNFLNNPSYHKFPLKDYIRCALTSRTCAGYSSINYHGDFAFFSNKANYILTKNNLNYDLRNYGTYQTGTVRDTISQECILPYMYNHILWCVNANGFLYKRTGKKWMFEMDQYCNDFKVTESYILCVNGTVFIKWRSKVEESITFSETEYGENQNYARKISASCSYWPCKSGPLYDAEIYQAAAMQKSYYLGNKTSFFSTAITSCKRHGGFFASIHSDEDVNDLSMVSSKYVSGTNVIVGLEGSSWQDGSPYDYQLFTSDADKDSKDCAEFNPNIDPIDWSRISCDIRKQFMCQSNGHVLSKFYPVINISFWNKTQCITVSYSDPFRLAALPDPTTTFTIFVMKNHFGENPLITYAAFQLFGDVASNTENTIQIGLLQQNHTNCLSMNSFDSIGKYLSSKQTIIWKSKSFGADNKVYTTDISPLLRYFIDTYRTAVEKPEFIPIVFFWKHPGPFAKQMKYMRLQVTYYQKENNKFLEFLPRYYSAKNLPNQYTTYAFPKNRQSFSFWYHMYGDFVGKLYVWLIDAVNVKEPLLVFVKEGNQGAMWRRAIISSPEDGVNWKLKFCAYRTDWYTGHIAIDSIESATADYGNNSTDFMSDYKFNVNTLNPTLLKKFGLIQPSLLYSFKHSLNDFSGNDLHIVTHAELCYQWKEDKLLFPLHAFHVSKSSNDAILKVVDLSSILGGIKAEFSIIFHLRAILQENEVTFFQFGDQPAENFQVNIDNSKLLLKHSGDTLYTSSWDLTNDTWTYIAVTYQNETLSVYMNNTVDDLTAELKTSLFTFPSSLYFFRDPSKLGSPPTDFFEGSISCFQFYNATMTANQVEALEFCPDRLELKSCEYSCSNGGVCVPLKRMCKCPSSLKRYYVQETCQNGFHDDLFKDATSYVSFDKSLQDEKKFFSAFNEASSYLVSSPINSGRCIEKTSVIIARTLDNCALDLEGCSDGFAVAFWLYIDQNEDKKSVDLYRFGNLVITADFIFNLKSSVRFGYIMGNITWHSSVVKCSGQVDLPFKAWFHINIIVNNNSSVLLWRINGENGNEVNCSSLANDLSISDTSLSFGNVSKLCIDEFVMYNRVENLDSYYNRLSNHIGDELPKKGILSNVLLNDTLALQLNYYPWVGFVVTCNDTIWSDDLQNEESVVYVNVKRNFEDAILSWMEYSIWDQGYKADVKQFSKASDGTVSAELNFLFKPPLPRTIVHSLANTYFYEYHGHYYKFERSNSSFGVPAIAVEYEAEGQYDIKINILNSHSVDVTNHKGYAVYYHGNYPNTTVEFLPEQEHFFYTGVDSILLPELTPYREYYLSIYRITHQGFGPPANRTVILLSPSVNTHPPTILEASPHNSTSIKLRWEEYDFFYWYAPDLLYYQIFYRKTSEVNNLTGPIHEFNHGVVNVSADVTEFVLEGLDVFTEYDIHIGTVNNFGLGALANVVQRSNEGVPELAPNITSIKLVNVTMVAFNWTLLPHDIDIYNSFKLYGYDISIVPLFPEFNLSCPYINVQVANNISELTHPENCKPMRFFNLSIAGYNNIGVGVKHEFCYVLGRTVPPQIQVLNTTFGPQMPNEMSSVNISIGDILLEDETTVVMYYQIAYQSLDWEDNVTTFNVSINHTKAELDYWDMLKEVFLNCSDLTYPQVSSKVVNYILTIHYYTNYTMTGKACSEEGCSNENLTIKFLTAEHSPFCPPPNVKLFNSSSTSLKLTFDALSRHCLSGELQFYGLILIETEKYHDVVRENVNIEDLISNATFYNETLSREIEYFGLHEYWNYTILAFAQNNGGMGVVSDPVYNMTDQDVPHGVPLNCSIEHFNSTCFTLTIGRPERLLENGVIHFEVNIITEYGDRVFRRVEVDGILTSTVFFNVTKFTQLNISISAVTLKGIGPEVVLQNRTLEDKPTLPPANFNVSLLSNDTFVLSWEDIPPRSVHGILQRYHLYGCGVLHNASLHCFDQNITQYNVTFTVFPGTFYNFTIAGCTRVGCGAEESIFTKSLDMVPNGPVRDLLAPNITANSINLTWLPVLPMNRRGIVTHYNITVVNTLHEWQSIEDQNEVTWIANTTGVLVDSLDNYTLYHISVAACTSAGKSFVSVQRSYKTKQNVPSAPPLNVTAYDTSSSSLNISWIPIPEWYHEGVLLGYVIFFEVKEGFTDIRRGRTKGEHYCNTSSCELTDLSLHTPYVIYVAGYTDAGYGVLSIVANGTTGEFTDGNWTSWTNWGNCAKSCGLGYAMRQRWCTNPKPEKGGDYCPGERQEFRPCNDFPCPGYYLATPGDNCRLTCENLGEQFGCALDLNFQNTSRYFKDVIDGYNYTRTVDVKCNSSVQTKLYFRKYDPSLVLSSGICRGYVNVPVKIDCDATGDNTVRRLCRCIDKEMAQYREWANWGLCNKDCGTGRYQRYRECIVAGGCTGTSLDKRDCNVHPCPVDGEWGGWSSWSNCSATCGFGYQQRSRNCDSPAPAFNGSDCVGDHNIDIKEGCNPMPCPVHGQWGEWQEVSECKHSCGFDGARVQKRYCDKPAPLYGGADCVGNNSRNFPCSENTICLPALYVYTVRFTEEVWEFPMYQITNEKSVNLSKKIEKELRAFYNSSEVSKQTENVEIEFFSMSRGSVIVQFSILYNAVPSIESLVLQHTVEDGLLNTMPTSLQDISINTLPTGPVKTLMAFSPTPFSINVSWSSINQTLLNGALNLYQVYYRPRDRSVPWDNFGTNNLTYTIIDLTPGAWYEIRVLTAISSGNGVASSLVEIQTIEGVPYIKPPSCTHQVMDSNTVYFSWDHIPSHEVPGNLLGYNITYRKYHGEKHHTVLVDNTMEQRTVESFKAYTWYWVEVAGYTSAGVGPHEVFVFRTPPGAPGVPPPNATAIDLYSTTELTITWDFIPKEEENGFLTGYRIFHKRFTQGGIYLVGESVHDIILDRHTSMYRVSGLESYTTYEFQIFGYSVYGDGPIATVYGRTCKCPKYLFGNWYEIKPYIEQVGSIQDGIVKGLFPDLMSMVVNAVCVDCKGYMPRIYYNRTRDGRVSKKENVDGVKKYLNNDVDISLPIFGRFALTHFGGVHPFVGIVASQGSAMLVYQPEYNTVGFVNILSAVAAAWPVILIAVLLATIMGWILWFAEQTAEESDLTQERSIYGAYEGFWCSFITMTTLGYGDYVPSSNLGKGLMIIWILTGLCVVSIFGGAVSSGMSVSSLDKSYKLYGAKVAAIKNSFEYRTAILRNAIIDDARNYTSVLDVIDAVSRQEVEIGLIDAITTKGYEKRLSDNNVKIYKILDLNSGYGVVLSGEFKRVETDVRSFVSSNQAEISTFVQRKIGLLQPQLLDVEELLLTPEESISLVLNMTIAYLVLSCVCVIIWYGWRTYRSRRKIAPMEHSLERHRDIVGCNEIGEEFSKSFREKLAELDEKHTHERFELFVLKKSYARHLRRAGKLPEEVQNKPTKKRKKAVRKHVLDS